MKKLLPFLLFAFFITSFKAYSQVPNPNFETWVNSGSYMDPQGWTTPNVYLSFFGISVVSRSNDKQSGIYAVQMQTKTSFIGIIPGAIVSGPNAVININNNTVEKGGFPFTNRPGSLDGFYKYTPVNGDTCGVAVALYKWNATLGRRDTIAYGLFFSDVAKSAYTPFSASLTYLSGVTPDTAEIIMSSSSLDNPQVNSTFIVDNISFNGVAGVKNNIHNNKLFFAYPNPVAGTLYIGTVNETKNNLSVKLLDLSGRLILEKEVIHNQELNALDISEVPAGFYMVQLQQDNERPQTLKIQITN